MMTIGSIRTYFDARVKEVDANLNAWNKDLFGNNDLNKAQAEKYYNLAIGPAVTSNDGNGFSNSFPITLDIYFSYKRDLVDNFDALYDKALAIQLYCFHPSKYTGTFSEISSSGITPIEEETNDNTIKMRLEFTVRKDCQFI